MTRALIGLELLRIRRSRGAWAILAFALIASLYAVWSGVSWRATHSASLLAYEQQIDAKRQGWQQTNAQVEAGERVPMPLDARPSMVEFPATHTVGALGHLAVGKAEMSPTRVNISPLKNQNLMIERYGFENPTTLTLGRFDLAFFVVVVLPLLIIALSFDIIAADRARGTINLLLSTQVSKRHIIATRLAIRNGLLIALTGIATALGLAAAPQTSASFGLLWIGVSLAYCLFWSVLIYLVVCRAPRSEACAATLVSLWMLLVFAVPALATSAGEALYPLPSKLAYLSEARVAQNDAWKQYQELTANYLRDHPDLSQNKQEAPMLKFALAYFLANEQEIANTASIIAAFDERFLQRSRFVDRLQYLSPAILAQRALFRIAGSDFDRSQAFLAQTRKALTELNDALRPAILSNNRISSDQFAALPEFRFTPATFADVLRQVLLPTLFLVFCAGLFVVLEHGFGVGRTKYQYSPLTSTD